MLLLNQDALLARYKSNPLKMPFKLVGLYHLNSDQVVDILASCTNPVSAYHFIFELQAKSDASINVNGGLFNMGSCARFLLAYVNLSKKLQQKNTAIYEYLEACLSNAHHNRSQLENLLHNLSIADFKKYVIEPKTFHYHDLLHLANDEHVISSLMQDRKLFLYDYFNPAGSWHQSKTPLLSAIQMASEVEHSLGLNGQNIQIKTATMPIQISIYGGYTQRSLSSLVHFISSFLKEYPNEYYYIILEAMQFSMGLLQDTAIRFKDGAAEDILSRLKSDKITPFSPAWTRHTVALFFYKGYLCFCNRGERYLYRKGTRIYAIKDYSKITPGFLKELLNTNCTADHFMSLLGQIVDLDNPLLALNQKPHRHPNCTFANSKSSIAAMLLLLECTSPRELNEFEQKRNYRRLYKRFTGYYRNHEIDEIIIRMFYAPDKLSTQFFATLVKIVITEHHGKGRGFVKDRNDLKRAVSLYRRSTDAVKALLKQDQAFMTLMTGLEFEYEATVKASPPGLKDVQTTYLVNYGRARLPHKVSVQNSFITTIDDKPTPKMPFSYGMAKKMISRVT